MKNVKDMNTQEKYDKFLETMVWYFSEKETPTGFFHTVGRIAQQLETLNSNLVEADKSSTKLTEALNRLTLWGVIIAGLGVLVALGSLVFELYLYFS